MKKSLAKISLSLLLIGCFSSCNVVKRVGDNELLLTSAEIYVNDKKNNKERVNNLLYQKPNTKAFGIPLRLHIYNLARPNRDSLFEVWLDKNPKRRERMQNLYSQKQIDRLKQSALGLNDWLKKTGEAPAIIDSVKTNKSVKNIENYYYSNGWFDREVNYSITPEENQRASIDYTVKTGKPYKLDTLRTKITSPIIDSLYKAIKSKSLLKRKDQFSVKNFIDERERLNTNFRNSGVYHFSQDYVNFEIDTIGKTKKVNVETQILDRIIRNEDSTARVPFKIYKIKAVNIVTDDVFEFEGQAFKDSIIYKNFNLYSYDKMRYRPKAITDAIFVNKGGIFRDLDRTRTLRYLNELQTFKYPRIDYIENEADTTLTANIFLTPRKKFGLGIDLNISQSNIQTVGFSFSASLLARNVFRGAETLEVSGIGAIGASKDGSENDRQFFDINELGANIKLTIPRLFFPFNTDRVIPKYMSPSTRVSLGFTSQTNIGLDKQTVNGIFNYKWFPNDKVTNNLDLFSVQYVRNLNPSNYFGVYQNSFNRLENIALDVYNTPAEFINDDNGNLSLIQSSADAFIDLVLLDDTFQSSNPTEYQTVNNIKERKNRLTEDNLIFASNFSYAKDKRENVFDENFSIFRFKLEFAGNLLANASRLLGLNRNNDDRYEIFGVPYSQYAKTEFDYIKHWDLGGKNVLAMRSFFGIAIPYGNSTSIPFAKSFFAGGTNDNRAWTAYNLGPGSSSSNDEFNEANMKFALSLEYRSNLFGNINGALFIDSGNIWNVFDDVEDASATFDGFNSLKDIAIGAGFGIRYDFGFFVLRGDIGFKAYDPSFGDNNRWFNEFNFHNAVYNLGINYPF
ncbi:MAG: BamA/TamA family outer membrane protein [Bacteroidia bacterium]|nr:BamA/TamA family outer membrane protein [Bacteroidia bacterium]MBT8279552.1 BamA/TamA family outer membrane protein [Bacteroidia bacterium]